MTAHARTAFVHIGAPKTGTTAIQAAFSGSRDSLSARGFHYLGGDRNHSERLALAFWDDEDAPRLGRLRWIEDEAGFQRYRRDALSELEAELERTTPKDVIISGEELCAFSQPEVDRFIAFLSDHVDQVTVIAYVRHPQSWIASAAQQGAKWSGDLLDETFVAPRLPHYRRRFDPFRTAVGDDNFVLRCFAEMKSGFDVVRDFATVLGLADMPELTALSEPRNASVSHRSAILFSALNALHPPFVTGCPNPFRSYRILQDARLPGRRFELPRETVEAALPALEAECDWVNTRMNRRLFELHALPERGLDTWFEGERDLLGEFALTLAERCRSAQNELALKSLIRAQRARDSDLDLSRQLLTDASVLATDRWTLHLIATEAVTVDHPERTKMFFKQRLMRDIEENGTDGRLENVANPFDRPWLLPNGNSRMGKAHRAA